MNFEAFLTHFVCTMMGGMVGIAIMAWFQEGGGR